MLLMVPALGLISCGPAAEGGRSDQPATSLAQRPPAPTGVTPEHFGAVGDGVHDDTRAVQRALDAGGTVNLTAGKTYRQTNLLFARRAGETIDGTGTMYATAQRFSAFEITANDVTIVGPTFRMGLTTKRWTANAQMKIRVAPVSGTKLENIHVNGSAAAGIFLDGASHYLVQDVTVENTRADGIHQTGGAHDGIIRRPVVTNVGDDGVAVVSYGSTNPDHNIVVESPTVKGTPARGVSVVGGNNITETDVTASNTGAACVYIASEPSYRTDSVRNVRVSGAHLSNCNMNTSEDHGAVLIFNGRPSPYVVSDVTLKRFTINGTRSSAPWQVGIICNGGGRVNQIQFRDFTIAGPNPALYTQVSKYSVVGWDVNGEEVADHEGS